MYNMHQRCDMEAGLRLLDGLLVMKSASSWLSPAQPALASPSFSHGIFAGPCSQAKMVHWGYFLGWRETKTLLSLTHYLWLFMPQFNLYLLQFSLYQGVAELSRQRRRSSRAHVGPQRFRARCTIKRKANRHQEVFGDVWCDFSPSPTTKTFQ